MQLSSSSLARGRPQRPAGRCAAAAARPAPRLRPVVASASGSRSSSGPSSDSGGGGASGGEPGAARPAPSDLAAQLWLPGAPQPAAPGRPRSVSAASGAGGRFPSQADSLFNPTERDDINIGLAERVATRSVSDLDYLSELLAIQQDDGPKNLGFFGTRNMGMTHQKLVEILSYAMVSTGNKIYTSGATGTNAAVIKGALRCAEARELLHVILPQSRSKQPAESQDLLEQVKHVVEMPQNDGMALLDASRICNREIISKVQQVICFAFHDSNLLLETCREAKDSKKIVTILFLD